MDPSLMKFGFDVLMGLGNRELQKAQVQASNIVNAANEAARNLMRGANNELAAKRGSLARYMQAENNKRVMDDTGSSMEAALVNYRRSRDTAVKGNLEQQISFSEQAGAQAAQAAVSGLTGGVADLVTGTTALRKARIQQAAAERFQQGDYDAGQQQANILSAGLSSLDQSSITDDIDQTIDVFSAQVAPSALSVILPAALNYVDNTNKTQGAPKQSFKWPWE